MVQQRPRLVVATAREARPPQSLRTEHHKRCFRAPSSNRFRLSVKACEQFGVSRAPQPLAIVPASAAHVVDGSICNSCGTGAEHMSEFEQIPAQCLLLLHKRPFLFDPRLQARSPVISASSSLRSNNETTTTLPPSEP